MIQQERERVCLSFKCDWCVSFAFNIWFLNKNFFQILNVTPHLSLFLIQKTNKKLKIYEEIYEKGNLQAKLLTNLKNNQQLIVKAGKKIKDAQLFALRCVKSALCDKWRTSIYILSYILKRICNVTRSKNFI